MKRINLPRLAPCAVLAATAPLAAAAEPFAMVVKANAMKSLSN